MRKKIFIHIGFRKTATTTIQVSLARNYSLLLKHGILYPKAGRGVAHNDIAALTDLNPRNRLKEETLSSLAEEISKSPADKIVISSEIFSCSEVSKIQKLKDILVGDYEFFIIAFVRHQAAWLQSLWTQLIKLGKVISPLEDFVIDVINQVKYPEEPMMDYIILRSNPDFYMWLQQWEQVFGKESMIIRVLEKGQVKPDIFEEFLNILGVEETNQFKVFNKNTSPSAKTIETIRYYVTSLERNELPNNPPMSYFVADCIREYAELYGWDTKKYQGLTRQTYTYLENTYAESNAVLAKTYLNREQLFLLPYEEKPVTRFDPVELAADEILHLSTYILKRFGNDMKFASALTEYHTIDRVIPAEPINLNQQLLKLTYRNLKFNKRLQEIKTSDSWKIISFLQKVYGPVYRMLTRKSG